MEIHERIKILRSHFGMTQEEFGKKLGVSRDVIGNIEYDRLKRPDQKESLYRLICKEFNVNETWLRTGEGEMFKKEFLEDEYMAYVTEIGNGASDVLKQAIIKYGRLSPENRKIIDDAIDLLIKMMKEG